jgi:hypothetical protein
MLIITLPYILFYLGILLYVAVAVILVRKYLRIRDIGLVWLGIAAVGWPWVSGWIERKGRILALHARNGNGIGFFPFNQISREEISVGSFFLSLHLFLNLIGVSLLLIAVIYLFKRKSDTAPQTTA